MATEEQLLNFTPIETDDSLVEEELLNFTPIAEPAEDEGMLLNFTPIEEQPEAPPVTPKQRPKERNMLQKGWDFYKDYATGVAEGIGTMIPFTPRQHAPAYQMDMPLAQLPAEIVRGGIGFIGGTTLAGGNPMGGAAAVTADEASRIAYEEGIGALKEPENLAHLAVTGATSALPVKVAPKIAASTTGIKNKALQKTATVGGIGAVDALASGIQGGSEVLRTGGDIMSPEGLANVALSSGLGLGASVAGNAVTMHQPTKNLVEAPADMITQRKSEATAEDALKLTHSPESFTERRAREAGWQDVETDPIALDEIELGFEKDRQVDEAIERMRYKQEDDNTPLEVVDDAEFSLPKGIDDVLGINNEPPKINKRTYREDIERDLRGETPSVERIAQELYHNPDATPDNVKQFLPKASNKKIKKAQEYIDSIGTQNVADDIEFVPSGIREIERGDVQPPQDANKYYSDDDILDMMESDIIRQKGGDGSNGKRLETYKPYQEGTSDPDTTPEIGLSSQDREEVVKLSPTQADGGNTRFESAVGEPTPMDSDFDYVRSKADALTDKPNDTGNLRDLLIDDGERVMSNLGEDGKYVGSTNMKRLAVNDEVKKITASLLDTNITPREVTTFQDLVVKAADLNFDENKVKKIDPKYVSAEQAYALGNYALGKTSEYWKTGNARDLDLAIDALIKNDEAAYNAGLKLGSYRVLRKAWESQLPNSERATINIAKVIGHGENAKKNMTEFMEGVKNLGEKRNDPIALMHLMKQFRDREEGLWGGLKSYMFANMLSSPKTHLLNLTSNLANLVTEVGVINPISEKVGIGLGKGFRKVNTGQQSGESTYALVNSLGNINGLAEAGRNMMYVLKNGFTKRDAENLDVSDVFVEVFGGSRNKAVRGAGKAISGVNRMLQAGDELFKTIGYNAELNRLAYRRAFDKASNEGLTGNAFKDRLNELIELYKGSDKDIQTKAKEEAARLTFQEPVPFLDRSGKVDDPLTKVIREVWDRIVPFKRTPINVIKQGLEYSPLGLSGTLSYGGKRTQEQRVKSLIRATLGTSLFSALYAYFDSDMITGSVPKGESEQFYGQGKKPFSVKIGDEWVDYRSLGKLATGLTSVASAIDYIKKAERENKDISTEDKLINMVANAVGTITEVPVLAGISSLMEAMDNPNKAEQFASNLASQAVPYSAAQRWANTNQLTSDYVPDAEGFKERVQSGTVLADKLPRRRNTLGFEVRRGTDEHLQKFYNEIDRLNIRLPKPSNYVTVDGEGEKLYKTDLRNILAEREDFGYGQEILAYVNSQKYQSLTDDEKKWELERFLKEALPSKRQSDVMWDIKDRIGLQREQKRKQ